MDRTKLYFIGGILFTAILGTLSHFFYDWTGQGALIGLVSPVNESTWEHMKLVFFPLLFWTLLASPGLSGEYPAWEYRADSAIQRIMAETYEEMTGEKPVLTGIHAGVECGILSEKLPGIDCISYGPQMRDIHTARERLEIASVQKNYELTVRVLEKLK